MRKGWTKFNNGKAFEISEKYGGLYLAVYLTIYSHVNVHDGYAYPSQPVIIKEAGVSRNTLPKILKTLETEGYILVAKGEKGNPNKYFFPYEALYNEDEAQKRCGTVTAKSIPKNAQTPAISPVITFSDDDEDLF